MSENGTAAWLAFGIASAVLALYLIAGVFTGVLI
jgi:hypothetical protein